MTLAEESYEEIAGEAMHVCHVLQLLPLLQRALMQMNDDPEDFVEPDAMG